MWIAVGGTPKSVVRGRACSGCRWRSRSSAASRRASPRSSELYREAAREGGHDPAALPVSINSHTYVAETCERAADEFFPAYAAMMTRIGRERGWPPMTREQYEQGRAPHGHLLVGSPHEVADKILAQHELFGHDRFLGPDEPRHAPARARPALDSSCSGPRSPRACARSSTAAPRPPDPISVRARTERVGPRTQLRSWVFLGARERASLAAMSQRQPILLLGLAAALVAPASPPPPRPTVIVTGDGGQPSRSPPPPPLACARWTSTLKAAVPATDTANFIAPGLRPAAGAVLARQPVPDHGVHHVDSANFADYRGNGTYSRRRSASTPGGRHLHRRRHAPASTSTRSTPASASRAPPTKFLTRAPNSLITNRYELGVGLNPGASSYEVRYALGGVIGPDGAISGPSAETFVNTANGLADFRFDKPGRYVIVARATRNQLLHPVERAAPSSTRSRRSTSSAWRSPTRAARATRSAARCASAAPAAAASRSHREEVEGRQVPPHRPREGQLEGSLHQALPPRGYGKYRLRYTYSGSSLVAAGRVTQRITIRKRFFFG